MLHVPSTAADVWTAVDNVLSGKRISVPAATHRLPTAVAYVNTLTGDVPAFDWTTSVTSAVRAAV